MLAYVFSKIRTSSMYVSIKYIRICHLTSDRQSPCSQLIRINITVQERFDYLAAPSSEAKVKSHSRNDPRAKQWRCKQRARARTDRPPENLSTARTRRTRKHSTDERTMP